MRMKWNKRLLILSETTKHVCEQCQNKTHFYLTLKGISVSSKCIIISHILIHSHNRCYEQNNCNLHLVCTLYSDGVLKGVPRNENRLRWRQRQTEWGRKVKFYVNLDEKNDWITCEVSGFSPLLVVPMAEFTFKTEANKICYCISVIFVCETEQQCCHIIIFLLTKLWYPFALLSFWRESN